MKLFWAKYGTGILIALIVMLIAAIGVGVYYYKQLDQLRIALEERLSKAEAEISRLGSDLASTSIKLAGEKAINESFAGQIKDISGTVNVLEKIKNTDPQLLQKYSKVYFLNENYIPSKLSEIDENYLVNKDKTLKFHGLVLPHLNDLLAAATDDGVSLKVISAYRSFGDQGILKSAYSVTYGAGSANKFSADQGYSEHQLGTTIDFSTSKLGLSFEGFDKTDAFSWLNKNAYKYGFVISYPKKNVFYIYEPWHWRFVGIELAKKLHEEGKYFYDLDQRYINQYQANFFD